MAPYVIQMTECPSVAPDCLCFTLCEAYNPDAPEDFDDVVTEVFHELPHNKCANCGRPCIGSMCFPNGLNDGYDVCFSDPGEYGSTIVRFVPNLAEKVKYKDHRLKKKNENKRDNMNDGTWYDKDVIPCADGRGLPREFFYPCTVKKANLLKRANLDPTRRNKYFNYTPLPEELHSF